jgi:hypothetical protein
MLGSFFRVAETSMYGWIAGSAVMLIMMFAAYQVCQYCRDENVKITKCIVKLCKKFADDFAASISGPRH